MKNDLILKPVYVASVSGGKDSMLMLDLILKNPNKYPLDYVVYFDLENDFPFIKDIINKLEHDLQLLNIKFYKIKPLKSWCELYDKYGFPNRVNRWCNSKYKLNCEQQFTKWLKSFNCRPVWYLGFCKDEEKRFKYDVGSINDFSLAKFIYPLAEEGILESDVLLWARKQNIFNDYYFFNNRCGCMACPFSSLKNWAYLYKYYRTYYNYYINLMQNDRYYFTKEKAILIDSKVKNKYIDKGYQTTIFDFL